MLIGAKREARGMGAARSPRIHQRVRQPGARGDVAPPAVRRRRNGRMFGEGLADSRPRHRLSETPEHAEAPPRPALRAR